MGAEKIFEGARIRPRAERPFDLSYFAGVNSNYPTDGSYFDIDSGYRHRFNDFANWVTTEMGNEGVLLDVGGSVGHLQHILSASAPDITVLYTDYCLEALQWGKQHYPHSDPVQLSAAELPFSSDSINGVLFADVIEHLQPTDAEAALYEAHRVMVDGGHLFIGVPNRQTWSRKNWEEPTHLWIPTAEEMEEALGCTGFKNIEITTRGFPLNGRTRKLLGQDLRLPKFGSSLLVHAHK